MPLKTIVKVSHISNLSDARYCAGMGVEMLGFGVIPGKENYMPQEVFQDIRGWISGPRIIAEVYGLSGLAQIETIIKTYAPDYFELTYAEYNTFKHVLSLPCIVYFSAAAEIASGFNDEQIAYLLVDEKTSCADISTTDLPVLIKINALQNLYEKSGEGCFKGFVLEGPQELRPGVTNYEQLGSILEALEE
jgi:phosphoribosylanthranilate isomerase